jgi:excisionase family DNA binding protein
VSAAVAEALVASLDDASLERLADLLADRIGRRLGAVPAAQQSTAEAAQRLGVHCKTIERWCREERMPGAERVGRTWRVPVDAIPQPVSDRIQTHSVGPARRRRTGVESPAAKAILGSQSGRVDRHSKSGPGDVGASRGLAQRRSTSMDMQDGIDRRAEAQVVQLNRSTRGAR